MNPTNSSDYLISLDLGGTKLLGILINQSGKVIAQEQIPSPKGNEAVKNAIIYLVSDLQSIALSQKIKPIGIAIGVPGFVDSETGIMLEADNLDVKHLNLAEPLLKHFDLPTKVFHDVRSATLAEARYGSAKGYKYFALVNIGTGVAVGLYLDGKIYYGSKGQSGEIGHMAAEAVGPNNTCLPGRRLEAITSGPALVQRATLALSKNQNSQIAKLSDQRNGIITTQIIQEAASMGDQFALHLIEETADYLGFAIGAMMDLLSLECVVLAGGISNMGELLLNPIRKSVEKYAITNIPIQLTNLGNELGAIGAAAAYFEDGE